MYSKNITIYSNYFIKGVKFMYHSSEDTVNGAHGSIARTYLEEYRHLGQLQDAPATHDFKTYMTTSLIRRGILFYR